MAIDYTLYQSKLTKHDALYIDNPFGNFPAAAAELFAAIIFWLNSTFGKYNVIAVLINSITNSILRIQKQNSQNPQLDHIACKGHRALRVTSHAGRMTAYQPRINTNKHSFIKSNQRHGLEFIRHVWRTNLHRSYLSIQQIFSKNKQNTFPQIRADLRRHRPEYIEGSTQYSVRTTQND